MDLSNELEILNPDRTITVGGESVTVREYSWPEAMELAATAAPVLAEMKTLFAAGGDVSLEDLADLITRHRAIMFDLIARSIDRPVAFIEGLTDSDGLLLLTCYWRVNSGFFVRRLIMRLADQPENARNSPGSSAH